MGRPLCGVVSREGKMLIAFVRDEEQANEFMKLFGEPEAVIKIFAWANGIELQGEGFDNPAE